ncbi:hypothetical protein [Ornithinimicrobium sp. INDO-MA30-4]|uniref:hypothetical protein n=1 Tax=Ornithinimicrobium sp. INDO-MA30-4 TaxID=2908651 RepID=UPI001F1C3C5B|nr:hypothetical protein [Ornithinimicrobium sp. INDO-MA30-4]UJH69703.1 hypothetical protein L0A91_10260 [Ornithinimicrobium sp. INDO-MA30-4]
MSDGAAVIDYQVTEINEIDKDALASDTDTFDQTGEHQLVMINCSGLGSQTSTAMSTTPWSSLSRSAAAEHHRSNIGLRLALTRTRRWRPPNGDRHLLAPTPARRTSRCSCWPC